MGYGGFVGADVFMVKAKCLSIWKWVFCQSTSAPSPWLKGTWINRISGVRKVGMVTSVLRLNVQRGT